MVHSGRRLWIAVAVALLVAGCGDDATAGVTSTVVSDPTTQDIQVFAREGDSSRPVVMALHGLDGVNTDMAEMSRRLAEGGNVVFAPTWRTQITTTEDLVNAARDVECAYRYARTIADDYGGDLDKPVTFVGWSFGASAVLNEGLAVDIDANGQPMSCFGDVPRADVIVAISGCYYEYEGATFDFEISHFGHKDTAITLIAGEDDTVCPAWQTEKLAGVFTQAGYKVDVVILPDANHYVPILHDHVDGEWAVVDNPAGERTVQVILDAIAAQSSS